MEFEVLPAYQPERSKKVKPYDRPVEKKVVEKTVPKVLSHPKGTQPNKAYVELPPTILKHSLPELVLRPDNEDIEMVDEQTPVLSKDKQREQPIVAPNPLREPEIVLQKSKEHALAPKETPRFEVVNPKMSNNKMGNQPQYKYATELMNETNQKQVFQALLNQPV